MRCWLATCFTIAEQLSLLCGWLEVVSLDLLRQPPFSLRKIWVFGSSSNAPQIKLPKLASSHIVRHVLLKAADREALADFLHAQG